jgi:hypothetical protein
MEGPRGIVEIPLAAVTGSWTVTFVSVAVSIGPEGLNVRSLGLESGLVHKDVLRIGRGVRRRLDGELTWHWHSRPG